MKNLLLVSGIVGVLFMTTSATCTKEPELKDYNCKCTYVDSDTAVAHIEETAVVKADDNFSAEMECGKLESKYFNQFKSGTCLLQ